MYKIESAELKAENIFAGGFPVAKDFGEIKTGATINRLAPVIQGDAGIEEATDETLDKLIGIATDAPSGTKVVFYLTGEFFANALHMPVGTTHEKLKPAFRKLGIFLKEINGNG